MDLGIGERSSEQEILCRKTEMWEAHCTILEYRSTEQSREEIFYRFCCEQ